MIEKSSRSTQNTKLVLVLQSQHSEYDNVKTKGEESYPWYLLLKQQSMTEAMTVRSSEDQVKSQFTIHLTQQLIVLQ